MRLAVLIATLFATAIAASPLDLPSPPEKRPTSTPTPSPVVVVVVLMTPALVAYLVAPSAVLPMFSVSLISIVAVLGFPAFLNSFPIQEAIEY